MKKLFIIGCFLFLSACSSPSAGQPATPTAQAPLFPTGTLPPTPTVIPFTDTPAPTPAWTATPFPQFFTDEFDASLAGWVILQAGNEAVPNIKAENSRLLLQMDGPYTWVYALYGVHDYESSFIETRFVNNAMSPASMGLICNYSEADGWLEYNVSTDGTYNVLYGKWLSAGVADYLPILDGSSNQIQQSGVEQHIGMTCASGTLGLYVNGTLIRNVDVSHYERLNGKVGISASSYENTPVIASFDWVKVSQP